MRLRSHAILVATVLLIGQAHAAPGDLKPDWGDRGVARLAIEPALFYDVLPLADGTVLATMTYVDPAVTPAPLVRLDRHGRLDPGFGIGGYAHCEGAPCALRGLGEMALLPGGKLLVGGGVRAGGLVSRFSLSGALDLEFGERGQVAIPPELLPTLPSGLAVHPQLGSQLAVHPDGRIATAGSIQVNLQSDGRAPFVLRWLANGAVDKTFGVNGQLVLPFGIAVTSIAASGPKLVAGVLSRVSEWLVVRLHPDGRLDETFGIGGVVSIPLKFGGGTDRVLVQADGRIVVAGTELLTAIGPATEGQAVIVRLNADGSLDQSFGDLGFVRPHGGRTSGRTNAALQSDGKIATSTSAGRRLLVTRLNRDGSPDLTFAGAGTSALPLSKVLVSGPVRIASDGSVLVPGGYLVRSAPPPPYHLFQPSIFNSVVLALRGGNGSLVRPAWESIAIEYFHSGFGHFFMTSSAVEIYALDDQVHAGWTRTGTTMKVWEEGAGTLPVCRFFSGQRFAPKSSHFYSPYAFECDIVGSGSDWIYEGRTFRVKLPAGDPGEWTCDATSQPLYRAYNNGMTGAPNHRYLVERATLDAMLAKQWTAEGDDRTHVFACVPIQN